MPGASWLLDTSPLAFLKEGNANKIITNTMPELKLNKIINKQHQNSVVLFSLDRPYGATLSGTAIYNSWYSNSYSKQISNWASVEDVKDSIKDWRVDFVYWDQNHPYRNSDVHRNLLREYLVRFGKPIAQEGSVLALSMENEERIMEEIYSTDPDLSVDLGMKNFSKKIRIDKKYSVIFYTIEAECSDNLSTLQLKITWDKYHTLQKSIECNKQLIKFTDIIFRPITLDNMEVILFGAQLGNIKVSGW